MNKYPVIASILLTLTACGGGGNSGPKQSVNAGPNQFQDEGDVVQLDGAQSVGSGGGVSSYQWDQTQGTSVVLSNANAANPSFTAPQLDGVEDELLRFELTVVGNDDERHVDTVDVIVDNTTVTLTATARFESIPFSSSAGEGLDYSARSFQPSRGVTIAVGENCAANTKTATDENGNFTVTVPAGVTQPITICAELLADATATWDVEVVNNTNSNAQYGAQTTILTGLSDRDVGTLDMPSGWSDSSSAYTSTRVSGPFAILDAVYNAIQKTVAVDTDVEFPELVIHWSVDNAPESGSIAAGQIGTSHYLAGNDGGLYILGKADNDTDEFDTHVVIHEWGHYFEDKLSRSDSIGGSHSLGDKLDLRVAFGEGFGNALSGIVTDDPIYRDSGGASQAGDFSNNVELNSSAGWYSEATVQSMLYDMYDTENDGDDALSLGWKPLYDTFIASDYLEQSTLTSIYPYLEQLKQTSPESASVIDSFANNRDINGTDEYGSDETNDGGLAANSVLPIYTTVNEATDVTLCSNSSEGRYNKLGNRRFGLFQSGSETSYRVVTRSSVAESDTDVEFYLKGQLQARLNALGEEDSIIRLSPNSLFVIDITDYNYGGNGGTDGEVCSTVRVTPN